MKRSCNGSSGTVLSSTFLLILSSLLSPSCEAADTLKQGEVLRENQTLISANGVYALGFFSPGILSSNRYLGIWYEKFSRGIRVWVANRENPGTDSSGVFTVTEEGNLVISDGRGSVIWSAKASQARFSATNATLTLLDSGNLVLRDGSGKLFWESFWFPTDTLLPGMRIQLNLRTGENRILQSWKYVDDPAPGMYSLGIDPQRSRQLVAWRESLSIWRSGLWNGWTFRGLDASKEAELNFNVIGDEEQISYGYYFVNQSTVSRSIMGIDGQLRILVWNDEKRTWDVFWSIQNTSCDVYNRCQEFGICKNGGERRCQCLTGFGTGVEESSEETNWPERCERQSPLKCGSKDDQFQKVPNMKLPDRFLYTDASTIERCKEQCRGNCSCPAYAFVDIGGKTNTCLIWDGGLVDITEYAVGGDDLYIRLVKPDHTGSGNGSSSTTVIVVATLVPGVICFSTLIFCLWKFQKRKPGRGGREEEMSMFSGLRKRGTGYKAGEASKSADLPFMDFHCVAIATDNFAEENKLGEGGFGPVYKGKLMDGQSVAVKRLSRSSGQGLEELKNEVILICKLQHRNLVRLLGCCVEEDEKLLVYEYLPNKSLDKWLFDQGRCATLDWPKRVQIITGIARGLLYLHHDSRLRIIHRDLKPSNILLDEEMNPKISDFGMARIFGGNQIQANTNRVVGTYGYMSPEYAMKGLFSVKSDVFGFGVLLLEIVTGKRNNASLNLLEHVWRLWNEEGGLQLADPCIRESCPIVELTRYVHVGLLCVQEKADDRPTMPSVVVMLGSETAVLPPPKQSAFCYGGNATDSDSSSNRGMKGGRSINEMSITMLEGR